MRPSLSSFADELWKIAEAKKAISQADMEIFKTLMKGSPVKVKVVSDAEQHGGGYFDQVSKEIGISEKSFVSLAHELGHAELDKKILTRMLQSRLARMAYMATPIAGLGAGLLIAKGKKWGLLLPVATTLPAAPPEGALAGDFLLLLWGRA